MIITGDSDHDANSKLVIHAKSHVNINKEISAISSTCSYQVGLRMSFFVQYSYSMGLIDAHWIDLQYHFYVHTFRQATELIQRYDKEAVEISCPEGKEPPWSLGRTPAGRNPGGSCNSSHVWSPHREVAERWDRGQDTIWGRITMVTCYHGKSMDPCMMRITRKSGLDTSLDTKFGY